MTTRATMLFAATAMIFAVALFAPDATAQTSLAAPPKKPDAAAPKKEKDQGPQNALQGFSQNRDQPVKIQAASLEMREKDKLATFTGDVHLINGDTEMRCKVLVVFYDDDTKDPKAAQNLKAADPGPSGERQIKRIEAKGGVTVVQKDQNAVGESATFNMRENTVTLIGNVIVTRGADVLRGQRLAVDLTSGVSKMDGGRVDVLIDTRKPPEKTPEKK
jgi:lipopolysaccharide export system protein LptA